MTRKKYFLFALLLGSLAASAQQKGAAQLDIQYNVGISTGSLKQAVSNTSFRGVKANLLFGVNNNLSLGFGTGFQDFYQKYPRQMYKLSDGSDLSAVRSFSIQVVPVLAEAKWAFSPAATVQPYAALGVGGNLVNYNDYAGEFTLDQKNKFGFAARPELGVFVPFRKGGETGFTVGASYNIMPFKYGELTNLNSIGVHAGVTIPMRK